MKFILLFLPYFFTSYIVALQKDYRASIVYIDGLSGEILFKVLVTENC